VYNHVPDKATIEDDLTLVGLAEQADALEDVRTMFAALASAYRGWALSNVSSAKIFWSNS